MARTYSLDLLRDEPPRRRRGGMLARRLPQRRSDLVMLVLAMGACGAVLTNALMLQGGARPMSAPFGALIGAVPLPVPAPERRPAAVTQYPPAQAPSQLSSQASSVVPSQTSGVLPAPLPPARPAIERHGETAPAPQNRPAADSTSLASLAERASAGSPTVPRPPADVAVSARMMAVQKALAKLGYGPVRIDGRDSPATRAAVERFERDRRLPVTGVVSDRLVRELNAFAGLSIP